MDLDKAYFSNLFQFHPANDVTGPQHDGVRESFRRLAEGLFDLLSEGPDRTYALRKLQEAMWAANAAIACAPVPA